MKHPQLPDNVTCIMTSLFRDTSQLVMKRHRWLHDVSSSWLPFFMTCHQWLHDISAVWLPHFMICQNLSWHVTSDFMVALHQDFLVSWHTTTCHGTSPVQWLHAISAAWLPSYMTNHNLSWNVTSDSMTSLHHEILVSKHVTTCHDTSRVTPWRFCSMTCIILAVTKFPPGSGSLIRHLYCVASVL